MAVEKRSWVWPHFELDKDNLHVSCKLCPTRLTYKSTTSNLANHLKSKHPAVVVVDGSFGNNGPKVGQKRSHVQSKLQFQNKKQKSRAEWQNVTKSLVEMCALDLRPLSIVEGVSFRKFVSLLDPTYEIPCHTTIRNYTKYYYAMFKENLIMNLKQLSGIAFTTDTWTSCATEGYLTLTAHYIEDWSLKYNVLATIEINDHHTGVHLANILKEICNDFQISEVPVCGITTDNASNMVTMTTALEWPHIRCFAHTLQLSVKAGLKIPSISSAAAAGRKLVAHFKKSTLASNDLKVRQKQLNLPEHSLLQDVPTRWNATFLMFQRLIEQRLAIFAVLHNPAVTSPSDARVFELTDQIWHTIEEVIPVLKSLQVATQTISGSNYPTLSMVYPIVNGLLRNHLCVNDSDGSTVVKFKELVSKDLLARFPSEDETLCKHPSVLSCALDPRYKALKFLSEAQRQLVKQEIVELANGSNNKADKNNDLSISSKGIVQTEINIKQESQSAENSSMHFLLGDLMDSDDATEYQNSVSHEYEAYVKDKSVRGSISPLDWWKINTPSYPKISKLAKQFLCIPGTSVPSERVFSDTGNLVTKKRASLDPETVNSLIFLKSILSRDVKKGAVTAPAAATQAIIKTESEDSSSLSDVQMPSSEVHVKQEIPNSTSPIPKHNDLPPLPRLPDSEDL